MYLSTIFVIGVIIFLLFPLMYKVKNNLCALLSFIVSLLLTILIHNLFRKKIFSFSTFLNNHLGIYFKTSLTSSQQVYVFRLLCLFIICVCIFLILNILFRFIIKINVFKYKEVNGLFYIISAAFLKFVNSLIIIGSVLIILTIFNTFWNLDYGVFKRLFSFTMDWILGI